VSSYLGPTERPVRTNARAFRALPFPGALLPGPVSVVSEASDLPAAPDGASYSVRYVAPRVHDAPSSRAWA